MNNDINTSENENTNDIEESDDSKISWDRRPMLIYEDEIYYYTNDKKERLKENIVFDGKIDSEVNSSQIPTKNNQSNFGKDYDYFINEEENTIDVYLGDDKWMIFSKDKDKNLRKKK